MDNEKSRTSPLWYALGGAIVGVVLGVLYAPMKGSELRMDINEWRRKGREKKAALLKTLSALVPLRVKTAAAFGALKAGGAEAIQIIKEDINLDGRSN